MVQASAGLRKTSHTLSIQRPHHRLGAKRANGSSMFHEKAKEAACCAGSAPTTMVSAPTMAVLAAIATSAVDTAVAADFPAPATLVAMESAMDDRKMSPT